MIIPVTGNRPVPLQRQPCQPHEPLTRHAAPTPGPSRSPTGTATATAYAQLRTGWGRSEAYADLAITEPQIPAPGPPLARRPGQRLGPGLLLVPARAWHGRPLRLLARAFAAAALSLLVLALVPGQAAGPAVVTGLIVWSFSPPALTWPRHRDDEDQPPPCRLCQPQP
jgi:hypothetical protein